MKKSALVLSFFILFAACAEVPIAPTTRTTTHILPDTTLTDPMNVGDEGPVQSQTSADVLLFNGVGTSKSDWQSLQNILKSMRLTYRLVNSSTLDHMTMEELQSFKLIIIPGGNSNLINDSLSVPSRIRVRQAVREGGVSFLGICAGAYAAVGVDAESSETAYYGFAVAPGDYLKTWDPNGDPQKETAIPTISFADGTKRSLIWWNGPFTPEWKDGVVARYPDGKPAISQTWSKKGFVIVTGPHPEAPTVWQSVTGKDPDGVDFDLTRKLIQSALTRTPLPTEM